MTAPTPENGGVRLDEQGSVEARELEARGMLVDRMAVVPRRFDGVRLVNYEQLLRDLPLVRRYEPDLVIPMAVPVCSSRHRSA